MSLDLEKFKKVKERSEKTYKTIGDVNCPYLQKEVNFNVKGLDHIKFKRWNHTRPNIDQYMRFKLIHYAPEVIKKSHTIQGILKTKEIERKKINSRWEKILTNVTYYEFVAVMDEIRVRVIVKYIDGGENYFWSIIPFWKMDEQNGKRLLHYGKPGED